MVGRREVLEESAFARNRCSNQAGTLACLIPAERLPQDRGEGSSDAQDRRDDKAT
jgi:hypothetical protein